MTPERLLQRAIALRGQLRDEQDEADERGAYSPALHQAFRQAGFYRVTQPRLFGGYEFDLGTNYRLIVEISRGHPATGWCLSLGGSHAYVVASHWPEQAQRDLFGADGHFIAPHRVAPMGTLTPEDGGCRLRRRPIITASGCCQPPRPHRPAYSDRLHGSRVATRTIIGRKADVRDQNRLVAARPVFVLSPDCQRSHPARPRAPR
jgi:hypothetical protein